MDEIIFTPDDDGFNFNDVIEAIKQFYPHVCTATREQMIVLMDKFDRLPSYDLFTHERSTSGNVTYHVRGNSIWTFFCFEVYRLKTDTFYIFAKTNEDLIFIKMML